MKQRGRPVKTQGRGQTPVGKAIYVWRTELDLKEEQLAEAAELGDEGRGHISKVELGIIKQPREDFLEKIAEIFGKVSGMHLTGHDLAKGLLPTDLRGMAVDGRVAAGQVIERGQLRPRYVHPEREFSKGDFLLEVEGDSMIEDHIQTGDYVLVDSQDTQLTDGDLVVACKLDQSEEVERTLKRHYWHSDTKQVELRPSKQGMKSIFIGLDKWGTEWTIAGKAKGIYRFFGPGGTGRRR